MTENGSGLTLGWFGTPQYVKWFVKSNKVFYLFSAGVNKVRVCYQIVLYNAVDIRKTGVWDIIYQGRLGLCEVGWLALALLPGPRAGVRPGIGDWPHHYHPGGLVWSLSHRGTGLIIATQWDWPDHWHTGGLTWLIYWGVPDQSGAIFCLLNHDCVVFKSVR